MTRHRFTGDETPRDPQVGGGAGSRAPVAVGVIAVTLAVAGVLFDERAAPGREQAGHSASASPSSDVVVANGVVLPLPRLPNVDPGRRALGARLFHDPRLSKDGTIACVTCHDLAAGGDDGMPRSIGMNGVVGAVNAPTVLNAALNIHQFWDGRANSLEQQIDGPIHEPGEMGLGWPEAVLRVRADADYARDFRQSYGAPPDEASIKDAIATYERSLLTPGSPFDRYLLGDAGALVDDALAGWNRFQELGCVSCHQGINLGGNMFQRMGKIGDYFAGRELTKADLGRYNVTGRERDRHRFKVPTLRNVELTAPYFHDGAVASLDEAVRWMGRLQLGFELSADETRQITAFLCSLTGEVPDP